MNNPFVYTNARPAEFAVRRARVRDEVVNRVMRQEYVSILAPLQSGKTTFCNVDLEPKLRESHLVCRLDLQAASVESIIPEFTRSWQRALEDPATDGQSETPAVGVHALNDWLSRLESPKQAVFLVDELPIDPEVATYVLTNIRAYYNEVVTRPERRRHLFVFAGSEDLAFLTARAAPYRSVFNIAYEVDLPDLTRDETRDLVTRLTQGGDLEATFNRETIDQVFELTQGHPYLVQMLCSRIWDVQDERDLILQSPAEAVRRCDIEGSTNAQAMMGRLDKLPEERDLLAGLIRTRRPIPFAKTHRTHRTLQLQGCIRDADGYCKIRNPIYEVIFRRYFEAARASAPLASRETPPSADAFWDSLEPQVRPFDGLLHVRVLGPGGVVARTGTPQAPDFRLEWDQDYRLELALVEGGGPTTEAGAGPDRAAPLPVRIQGTGERDRPVVYRLAPESFTVDFTPREIPVEFPTPGGVRVPPLYFPFAFHTPPRPPVLDCDAKRPTPSDRRFQIFLRLFEGPNPLWQCPLQCSVGDPDSVS